MYVKSCSPVILLFVSLTINAQTTVSTISGKEQMPLNTPKEKSWWNLLHYSIVITPDYNKKSVAGSNEVTFIALQDGKTIEIDLQEPMRIINIDWQNVSLPYTRQENAYFITFPRILKVGETQVITIHFEGQPQAAKDPPFDSGWIWAKDEKGRPWMSIACEGSGASLWLPCKEVLYDEPDNGVSFSITVPDTLTAVANGRLQKKVVNKDGTTTYGWKVVNPINNYNIVPYIGKYVSWHENYAGLKGNLDCDFWVLDYSLEKARKHLQQTDTMLRAFEYWLSPYPFYEDGYKLVEAPMLGMEHQSAVAYGNGFQNGWRGKDFISGTGWGLKWDFMLVHESGHEWFGNSVTCSGDGDSWIHEGFTKYLETLYTSFVFGNEAGNEYAVGTWKRIKNDEPILGTNTSDKYYKGSAMLHTIRQVVGDTVFKGWLHGLQQEFYHQTVSTKQILEFLNRYTKKDFSKVFAQYLQTTQIPTLEYSLSQGNLMYRWSNCVDEFDLPVRISFDNNKYVLIYPTTHWQKLVVPGTDLANLSVNRNFLVKIKRQVESE